MRIGDSTIQAVKQVSVLELAERLGDQPKQVGSSFQVYCPNPAHSERTPDTYIRPDGVWKCFGGGGCGAQGNDAIKYYAWKHFGYWDPKAHFVDSVLGIAKLIGIPVIQEGTSSTPREIMISNTSSKFSKVNAEIVAARCVEDCDRIYRKLLQMCPIYRDHAAEWLGPKRQYSVEHIKRIGLRSVPATPEEMSAIINGLLQDGESLERIPGFTQRLKKGGNPSIEEDWYWTVNASKGYFIPVRDEWGYIVRLRVATFGKPKYIWLSSTPNLDFETNPLKMRKGGAPSGAPINIMVPADQLRIWVPGTDITDLFRMDEVIVTEGEHKASIVSNRLNKPVIGVPGVGNFSEVIPTITRWGTKKLILAYDSDSLYKEEAINGKNEQVFKHLVDFASQLLTLDINVKLWTWNVTDGKGLDDVLLAGKLPIEIDLRTKERKPVVLGA